MSSNTEGIDNIKEILRTLAIAYEDPTIDELKVIAELSDSPDAEHVQEQVRACGPLLRIYDSSDEGYYDLGSMRVTFVHPLAKESLLRSSRKLIGLSDDDEDQLEVRWQHGVVALRCLAYTFGKLEPEDKNATWEEVATGAEAKDEMERDLDEIFPEEVAEVDEEVEALEYPLSYWLRHGNESTPDFVDTLDLKHAFWAMDSSVRRRWWSAYADRDGYGELTGLTAMHVAAFFGLTSLMDPLIATGHSNEIRIRDSWENQPLHWAAERGHLDTMEKLLSLGADINDGIQDQVWTPLHMAASTGQVEAIELLLSGHYGATELNAVSKEVGTPFTLAISCNQKAAAELLLAKGASPTLTSDDFESPVAIAALRGYDDVVDNLLRAGASQNMVSRDFGSALGAAASAGHFDIVERLMRFDNDLTSHQRALEEAAQHNFNLIVRLLLQGSAQLHCDKSFEMAASQGHDAVIKEIWAHHQQHNALTQISVNNALYVATDGEQETTVDLLLRYCGADPNSTGEEYGNAVTAAAYDGNVNILKTLINARADLNAVSGYPLQAAASQGHEDVVAFLLQHGASADGYATKHPDGTPLQAACVAGNSEIAKMLLTQRANPNRGSGDFTNPLIAAASQGHGDLLELLLEHGADPNVFGGADKSTPLINAAATLPANRLEVLIKHGARVDTQDPDEDNALILSALVGDDDCVEMLLKYGANINISGKHNGTALHAAASNGHVETCRLLLQRGADPTVRGGPYDTVFQAAAISGNKECLHLVLDGPANKGGLRSLQFWHDKIDVNVQGGSHFTALHAAAAEPDDGCLRLLLQRSPAVSVVPRGDAKMGTPLHSAAFAGCNRNARLLLEAGADPNITAGSHGTVLQAAALKCGTDICELLLEHGAKTDKLSGKYGSALVAAVVRDYHEWDTSMLEFLLAKEFPPEAYYAALEKAFNLQRKEAFRLIWKSVQSKDPKTFKGLNVKQLLGRFKFQLRGRGGVIHTEDEDANSDFADDVEHYDQDFEDEYVETEEEDDDEDSTNENQAGARQLNGGTDRSLPIRSSNGTRGLGDAGNGYQISNFTNGAGNGGTGGTENGNDVTMGGTENRGIQSTDPATTGYEENHDEGQPEHEAGDDKRGIEEGEGEHQEEENEADAQEEEHQGSELEKEEPEEGEHQEEEEEGEPDEDENQEELPEDDAPEEEAPEEEAEEEHPEEEEEQLEEEEPEEEQPQEDEQQEEEEAEGGWRGKASRWMDRL